LSFVFSRRADQSSSVKGDPPESIASVAVLLASEEGAGITGTVINVFGSSNFLFRTP
jgi:hypothetical protein